jgi:hypothetical protein
MWVVKLFSVFLFVFGAGSLALAPFAEPQLVQPGDTNPMRDDGFAPKLPDMGPSPAAR